MSGRNSVLIGAFAASLGLAQSAVPWTRVTQGASDNLLEPAAARTKDGVLHVIWSTAGAQRGLFHSALAADGKPKGPASAIVTGWSALSRPKVIIIAPDATLAVLFSGVPGGAQRDDLSRPGPLSSATSKDGGLTWELAPGTQPQSANGHAGDLAAVADREGKPLAAFTSSGKVVLQTGLGATQPVETVRDGPCCAHSVRLAADSDSFEIWAAWRQTTSRDSGLSVRAVKPAMSADSVPVPGSTQHPFALSARAGAPGVYLAYFTGNPAPGELKLWNVRGGEPLTVVRQAGRQLWLTPGPEGRLWILWSSPAHSVLAIRSNKALTRFSAPYAIGNPGGAAPPVWQVAGEGSTGPLDALVNRAVAGKDKAAIFHARLYPNLQLSATSEGILVADLGDPVEGVEVSIEGQTVKSGANGVAAFKLTPGKPTLVKAKHTAYAAAGVTVTLPKAPEPKKAAKQEKK